jgi:alpha-L-rhamnosidase
MLENGATTTWERWEYLTGGAMNSHNHPMLGSVGSWFFKYLAGILPDAAGPGFSRFVIQPRFIDGLEWVEGSYRVLPGMIRSAWRKVGRQVVMTISVPANTIATVHFPAASPTAVTERGIALPAVPGVTLVPGDAHVVVELGSGDYEFTVNH